MMTEESKNIEPADHLVDKQDEQSTKQVVIQSLQVNRDLINTQFESYRLNRDAKHTILTESLPDGHQIHSFKLDNLGYSYCHASMLSGINHLYYDRSQPHRIYFITEQGSIFGSFLDTNREDDSIKFNLKNMFTIPDFNPETMYASLTFPSPSFAIILLSSKYTKKFVIEKSNYSLEDIERIDYGAKLLILKRAFVDDCEMWTVNSTLDISRGHLYSNLNLIGSSHFHLYDSSSVHGDNNAQSIVIGSVNECFEIESNQLKSRFIAVFHRIELKKRDANLTQFSLCANNRFIEVAKVSNDFPKYVSLGNADDILFASQTRMNFNSVDSLAINYNGTDNTFHFSQAEDRVTLKVDLDILNLHEPKDSDDLQSSVIIDSDRLHITISLGQRKLLLSGTLEFPIIKEESTYEFTKNNDGLNLLEINLKKQNANQVWRGNVVHISNSIFENCRIASTEESIFLAVEEIDSRQIAKGDDNEDKDVPEETEAHQKAEFTKAVFDEYENCDLQDSDSSLVLTRFHCTTGQVLDEFDLSLQKWLFSIVNYSAHNRLPYFVTRHTDDALVYEPQTETLDSGHHISLAVKHLDLFPAFGYVSASKQNRRFMTFGQKLNEQMTQTEWNYGVIDNGPDRMLYVYDKPSTELTSEDGSSIKTRHGQHSLFHFDQSNLASEGSRPVIFGLYALPTLTNSILTKHEWKNAVYIMCDEKLHLVLF